MSPTPDVPETRRVDLFCQVIDNLGDVGVCWRLARQMVDERGWSVRLFVDQLDVLARIAPTVVPGIESQWCAGVLIQPWPDRAPDAIGDVVIEAFGCRLPDALLDAMAARPKPPLWLNLEYLSAESWVDECHGLPSPDPRRPLTKYFFFPGFTPSTGGLPCERHYDEHRAAFMRAAGSATFLDSLGVTAEKRNGATLISLFCYADSPINSLALAWQQADRPVLCLLPAGAPATVTGALGIQNVVGDWKTTGQLTTRVIPFLDSADYDRLLCACDLNLVRGEDSFLRAQWACRPTIWQPYRQEESHHRVKLAAFLDRYLERLPPRTAGAIRDLSLLWSPDAAGTAASAPLGALWNELVAALSAESTLSAALTSWSRSIRVNGTLLDRLALFIDNKLK